MSVTISPDTSALPYVYGVTCYASGEPVTLGDAATYAGGKEIRAWHLLMCETCRTYGCYTEARSAAHGEAPSLNMSNSNAARVLRTLGLYHGEDDLWGSVDAATLVGVADAYLTLVESPTIAWDGYIVDRVTRVADVARYAVEHGLGVSWA